MDQQRNRRSGLCSHKFDEKQQTANRMLLQVVRRFSRELTESAKKARGQYPSLRSVQTD